MGYPLRTSKYLSVYLVIIGFIIKIIIASVCRLHLQALYLSNYRYEQESIKNIRYCVTSVNMVSILMNQFNKEPHLKEDIEKYSLLNCASISQERLLYYRNIGKERVGCGELRSGKSNIYLV